MSDVFLGIVLNDKACSTGLLSPGNAGLEELRDQDGELFRYPSYLAIDTGSGQVCGGNEALQMQGLPGVIVLHKLVSLFYSGFSLDVQDHTYTADELMGMFLKSLVDACAGMAGLTSFTGLGICIDGLNAVCYDRLKKVIASIGMNPEHVLIMNSQESFAYYMLHKKREYWNQGTMLFEYEDGRLETYELKPYLQYKPVIVQIQKNLVEENCPPTDAWFAEAAGHLLAGGKCRSCFLYGSGFEDHSWAREFKKTVSNENKRRIFQDPNLFARGAAYGALDAYTDFDQFNYTVICDERISIDVWLEAEHEGKNIKLQLASAGTNCYECRSSTVLELIEESTLELCIRNTGSPKAITDKEVINLSDFVSDQRKRTKVRMTVLFLKDDRMTVRVEDLGFGEIYPSTGKVFQHTYTV